MLTIEKLELMENGLVFAKGIVNNPHLYKDKVRWIAKRGGGPQDWAIYYHLTDKSYSYIESNGDKCFTELVIKDLVPCNDEAYRAYRL